MRADGTPVTIQSVVVDKTDADICAIYISRQAGITTVAGMSAADAVVRVPKSMMEGAIHGFSGSAENAKISIAYGGVTYNQANTTNGAHLAAGGNTSVALQGSEIEMTFKIFSIVQYDGDLSGYYKGTATVIE